VKVEKVEKVAEVSGDFQPSGAAYAHLIFPGRVTP